MANELCPNSKTSRVERKLVKNKDLVYETTKTV